MRWGQVRKPPVYFYFGNRAVELYHTRLRLEGISLSFHLLKIMLIALYVLAGKSRRLNINSQVIACIR